MELIGNVAAFEKFQSSGGTFAKPFPTSSLIKHLSYDELNNIAIELLGRDRLNTLKQLKARAGFNATQTARITGIGQATIHRVFQEFHN